MSQKEEEYQFNEKHLKLTFKGKQLDFNKEIQKVRIEQETTIKLKKFENKAPTVS